jgi:hypothetical protein
MERIFFLETVRLWSAKLTQYPELGPSCFVYRLLLYLRDLFPFSNQGRLHQFLK